MICAHSTRGFAKISGRSLYYEPPAWFICNWIWENLLVMNEAKYLEIHNSIIQSVVATSGKPKAVGL